MTLMTIMTLVVQIVCSHNVHTAIETMSNKRRRLLHNDQAFASRSDLLSWPQHQVQSLLSRRETAENLIHNVCVKGICINSNYSGMRTESIGVDAFLQSMRSMMTESDDPSEVSPASLNIHHGCCCDPDPLTHRCVLATDISRRPDHFHF